MRDVTGSKGTTWDAVQGALGSPSTTARKTRGELELQKIRGKRTPEQIEDEHKQQRRKKLEKGETELSKINALPAVLYDQGKIPPELASIVQAYAVEPAVALPDMGVRLQEIREGCVGILWCDIDTSSTAPFRIESCRVREQRLALAAGKERKSWFCRWFGITKAQDELARYKKILEHQQRLQEVLSPPGYTKGKDPIQDHVVQQHILNAKRNYIQTVGVEHYPFFIDMPPEEQEKILKSYPWTRNVPPPNLNYLTLEHIRYMFGIWKDHVNLRGKSRFWNVVRILRDVILFVAFNGAAFLYASSEKGWSWAIPSDAFGYLISGAAAALTVAWLFIRGYLPKLQNLHMAKQYKQLIAEIELYLNLLFGQNKRDMPLNPGLWDHVGLQDSKRLEAKKSIHSLQNELSPTRMMARTGRFDYGSCSDFSLSVADDSLDEKRKGLEGAKQDQSQDYNLDNTFAVPG